MKGLNKFLATGALIGLLAETPGCTSLEKKIKTEPRTPQKELAMNYARSKLPTGVSRRLSLEDMRYIPNTQTLRELGIYGAEADSLLNAHERIYYIQETNSIITMDDVDGNLTFGMYFRATKE